MRLGALVGLATLTLVGCHTYRDQLAHGERAYNATDYDRSIALLRDIQNDFIRLRPAEQADYAFVRGMSDYNIGYKLEARHWLAIAKACDDVTPGSLGADQKAKLSTTLTELNKPVLSDGTQALADVRKDAPPAAAPTPSAQPAKKAKPKANPDPTSSDDDQ